MKSGKRRFFSFLRNDAPQRYFAWMQFLILGLLLLCILYSSFFILHGFSVSSESSGLRGAPVSLQLEVLYGSIFWPVILIFAGAFLVNALIVLIFLHRLTGPLVRIEQVLRDIGNGTVPVGTVRFRRGDFLEEICEVLNQTIHSCRRVLGSLDWTQKFAEGEPKV